MIRKTKLTLVLLTAVLTLFGCSTIAEKKSEKYAQRNVDISFARNIALYTSLTDEKGPLNDVNEGDFKKNLEGASDHATANAIVGVVDTAIALKALLAPSALMGFSPAMLLLSPRELSHPALRPMIIAWMPKNIALDKKKAAEIMEVKLKEAFFKSLPGEYKYEEYETNNTRLVGGDYKRKFISLIGPGCPVENEIECRFSIVVREPLDTEFLPEWIKAPGGAYFWKNWKDGATGLQNSIGLGVFFAKRGSGYSAGRSNWMEDHQDEVFQNMSMYLDDWIYIYVPPTINKPYPAIFNAGKTLFFVKPRKDS